MVIHSKKHNKGQRAEFGNLCFDNGTTGVFVGYHSCPGGCNAKIILTLSEVKFLATKYGGQEQKKFEYRKQLINWLYQKYC